MVRLLLLSVILATVSCGGGIESSETGDQDAGQATVPIDTTSNTRDSGGTSEDNDAPDSQPTQCLGPQDGCGNLWCFPFCDNLNIPNPITDQNSPTAPRLAQ